MQVIHAVRFGGPEVLVSTEAAEPVPGPGEAIVGVAFADVLFLDTVLRSGAGREWFGVEPPYVPGPGVAGEVLAVGPGVDEGWVGERVVARTGEGGGYAERVAVAADGLVVVPEAVGLPEAAALLHDGPTALRLFDEAQIKPGEFVLVLAAAGGLGSLLVQLASAAGARVIAAARGERKLALARDLGAGFAVDYGDPGWVEQVRWATSGAGVGVVFDGAGGALGEAAFTLTAPGGRFSSHGAPSGAFAAIAPEEARWRDVTVRGIEQVQFGPQEARDLMVRTLEEAATGSLRPVVGQTFPLARANDAHASIEGRGAVAKTLLEVAA